MNSPDRSSPTGSYRIVVSAVNLREGGPLTVLRECLAAGITALPSDWEIVALVHDVTLVESIRSSRLRCIAIPSAMRSWFHRLWWEWFGFRSLAEELRPSLWLSLHDITPRLSGPRMAVYCHNPSPFFRMSLGETWMDPKLRLFTGLYGYLYGIRIHCNDWVIVQQEWLRREFTSRFGELPLVVAHPVLDPPVSSPRPPRRQDRPFTFIYPALPRVFKNFEVIGEALMLLQASGFTEIEVRFTLSGTENRYARWLHRRFSGLSTLKFIGRQTAEQMARQYDEIDALLFPSKLETWGLPITEAKSRGLPMLVAEGRYAHETVGSYDAVSFFDPASPEKLAELMKALAQDCWKPQGSKVLPPQQPFAADWATLWSIFAKQLTVNGNASTLER